MGTVAAALCLALTGASAQAGDGQMKVAFTTADQAAARAAVIVRPDLGSAGGWKGGHIKPTQSDPPDCPGYHPTQADLVLTGDSETDWKNGFLEFDSEAQVLRTVEMVARDWRRQVLPAAAVACLRTGAEKALGSQGKVVFVRRLAVQRIATHTAGFRAVFDIATKAGTFRAMVDTLLVGRGRTELILTTRAPYSAAPTVYAAELRLARILAGRARA